MPNVIIPLKTPIPDHKGLVRAIELREPTFDEYMTIGDPYEVAESDGGQRFAVQNPDAVRSYLEACLVTPSTPDLLRDVGVGVARKVRNAILGFFQDGDGAAEASKTSPTNSSSAETPTSMPDQSAA